MLIDAENCKQIKSTSANNCFCPFIIITRVSSIGMGAELDFGIGRDDRWGWGVVLLYWADYTSSPALPCFMLFG